jgi:ABC-type multidrug transport system fused ATPase/permease subunit
VGAPHHRRGARALLGAAAQPAGREAALAVTVDGGGWRGAVSDKRAAGRGTAGDLGTHPGWYPAAWNKALLAAGWPTAGAVSFNHVSARYREGLPLVLRDVTFDVPAGAKVAVCGRTGSGKTSLTLTLFRVLELAGGSISIDGVDIGRVVLYHLRSVLAVIPQDPTLWQGSLRTNLDMFGEHSDEALWRVLRQAGLADFVAADPAGLGRQIHDGGKNVSVGQRQLICLARAVLRGSRVIIMDEATASLDYASDQALQHTLRTALAGITLIIVAHRLHTIMDADAVVVLDDGRLVEHGPPLELMRAPAQHNTAGAGAGAGIFKSLVEETGPETATLLMRMAEQAHTRRTAALRTGGGSESARNCAELAGAA